MSTIRRIIDGAKSGLNTLLDRVTPAEEGFADEASVRAELDRRARVRSEAGAAPARPDGALPRAAGASAEARRERQRLAQEREARVHGKKKGRAEAEAKARDEAFRQTKERAQREARSGGGPRPGAGAGAGSAGPGGGPRRPGKAASAMAKHYKTLDLPEGSDFPTVKSQYRKLMRKFHPDLHGQSPEKQRAATELSKQITQAFNELEEHLLGGPNKGAGG